MLAVDDDVGVPSFGREPSLTAPRLAWLGRSPASGLLTVTGGIPLTDNRSDLNDPTVPPTDEQWPADPPPTLEQDLAVLAWLQASHQLSGEATGYICAALLEWVLLGESWPRDPAEPVAGPDCDHLEALVQITERWVGRSVVAVPISRRFEMAMVGRELSYAIRCQTDPQQLAESIEREMVHRMPWLAAPPPLPCCSLTDACCEPLGAIHRRPGRRHGRAVGQRSGAGSAFGGSDCGARGSRRRPG